jgi:hypothetical protein
MSYISTHAKVDALKQESQPPYFAVTANTDNSLLARFFVSNSDVVADVFNRAKNFADAYDPALIVTEPEYNDTEGQSDFVEMQTLVNGNV